MPVKGCEASALSDRFEDGACWQSWLVGSDFPSPRTGSAGRGLQKAFREPCLVAPHGRPVRTGRSPGGQERNREKGRGVGRKSLEGTPCVLEDKRGPRCTRQQGMPTRPQPQSGLSRSHCRRSGRGNGIRSQQILSFSGDWTPQPDTE